MFLSSILHLKEFPMLPPSAKRTSLLMVAVVPLTLLSACAHGGAAYRPIVDGPMDATYVADLGACQNVAETRNYINSDTKTNAAIGAGIGGIIGLADNNGGSLGSFIGGALAGALLGGADGALDTRSERKNIVTNCMAGRGHRVVG